MKLNLYIKKWLLNANLVSNDRKNGLICIDKYFFIFLRTLRLLKKCKKEQLFRCINCKVKLEDNPNNNKYIPYKEGYKKTLLHLHQIMKS